MTTNMSFRNVLTHLSATTLIASLLVLGSGGLAVPSTALDACLPPPDEPCPTTFSPPSPEPDLPVNIGALKVQLKLYYRCSYRRDVDAVLAAARKYIDERAGQVSHPAVVLDIDETALSNWVEIWQNDFGYIPEGPCEMKPRSSCGVHAWEHSAQDPAIN